ncbi:MAG: hypothetical protein AVDCRST_MAG09-1860 [uncultured Sphingomonas sp.]|uniref:DUF2339 domain-containing protein n=1 Tax=uncultured Sphingomonas sp. TaxID=158754 RepID=A0A6J4TBF1_9SPHN|nr:MAG: hypothetical protein AVDCRST_MAG09-1860 [uncultured Sphingomonas sp.]
MILWAAVAGALLGWALAGFETFGAIFGALVGALMGRWLRSIIREEIALAVAGATGMNRAGAVPQSCADWVEPRPARIVENPPAPAPLTDEVVEAPTGDLADAQDGDHATPSWTEELLAKARDWLLGGNTIVRVGLIILFVGLTFLVRLVANAGLFPIEVRLTLVALAGAALLAVGFARRIARPAFGLALQGTGVAVMYLTVFAAARVYGLLPPPAAFGLMILLAALGCVLALLQHARGLAFASFLGGFAVPLLLGGEARNPVGLFTYITILNLALLGIAWRRSWRELNLLGFFATFGMATLWGVSSYAPQHYLTCQLFLGLTMLIYILVATLYVGHRPGPLGNAADTTLLFGPALAGFGLQMGLVHDRPFGNAFAALAFGAGYLSVAAFMLRRQGRDMRVVRDSLLAIGIGFVTLAVPLAFYAKWTSSVWALEGAGAFWVGVRQARWLPRLFGLLLQLVAALILLATLAPNVSAVPFGNTGFVSAALVALPLLITAWLMRQKLPHSGSRWARAYAGFEHQARHVVFLGGFTMVAMAILAEVTRQLPRAAPHLLGPPVFRHYQQVLLAMLALLGAAGLADLFGRRKDWAVATWPARASLPLLALSFLLSLLMSRHVLFWPDWLAWLLALSVHYALLRGSDAALSSEGSDALKRWNGFVHAGGVWLLTAMLANCLQLGIDRGELWDTSWAGVTFLVSLVAVLGLLTRSAGRAAPQATTDRLRWPLHPAARSYWWVAAVPLAALAYAGAFSAALRAEGTTDPLPFVPLLNPVDLSVALALVVLALWLRTVRIAHDRPDAAAPLLGQAGYAAGGALAFAALNGAWLRTAHHLLGVDWSAAALGANSAVQTGLAILWTLLAMGLMLFAHRRALRVSWLVGAALLVVVVLKLLLVDMSNAQGWERIVTFIGVGVLMLVIGYFVPLPPRQANEEQPA